MSSNAQDATSRSDYGLSLVTTLTGLDQDEKPIEVRLWRLDAAASEGVLSTCKPSDAEIAQLRASAGEALSIVVHGETPAGQLKAGFGEDIDRLVLVGTETDILQAGKVEVVVKDDVKTFDVEAGGGYAAVASVVQKQFGVNVTIMEEPAVIRRPFSMGEE